MENRGTADFRVAGAREAGARCVHCQVPVEFGERVAVCAACGAVQHERCWHQHDERCGAYECQPDRRALPPGVEPVLKVTAEDIARAAPLPVHRPVAMSVPLETTRKPAGSGLAWASFFVALAGIPLFGLLTGLVAILLGAVAVGQIVHTRGRGLVLAVFGILMGLGDVIGWSLLLYGLLGHPQPTMVLEDLEPDPAALEHLAPHISRAMKANVLIVTQVGWHGMAGRGIGSGVILRLQDGQALIVTNRHVVDPAFADHAPVEPAGLPPDGQVQVKLIGQPPQAGHIAWIAPDGIDLALVTVPATGEQAEAAAWQRRRELVMGSDVFSIGNPQELGWTHTRGSISQLRLQSRGNRKIQVIQTDAAINPGNSGGGLYDQQGYLIGINTWTKDKRFSEGISFAIALESLLGLDPPLLKAEQPSPKGEQPVRAEKP